VFVSGRAPSPGTRSGDREWPQAGLGRVGSGTPARSSSAITCPRLPQLDQAVEECGSVQATVAPIEVAARRCGCRAGRTRRATPPPSDPLRLRACRPLQVAATMSGDTDGYRLASCVTASSRPARAACRGKRATDRPPRRLGDGPTAGRQDPGARHRTGDLAAGHRVSAHEPQAGRVGRGNVRSFVLATSTTAPVASADWATAEAPRQARRLERRAQHDGSASDAVGGSPAAASTRRPDDRQRPRFDRLGGELPAPWNRGERAGDGSRRGESERDPPGRPVSPDARSSRPRA
jgi:hypothetical protein